VPTRPPNTTFYEPLELQVDLHGFGPETQVLVSWKAPFNPADAQLDSYTVSSRATDGGPGVAIQVSATELSDTFPRGNPPVQVPWDKVYTWEVTANWQDGTTFTCPPLTQAAYDAVVRQRPSSAPYDIAARTDQGVLYVTWAYTAWDETGACPPTMFEVDYYANGAGINTAPWHHEPNGGKRSYTVAGVPPTDPGNSPVLTVTAINQFGPGPRSPLVPVTRL
jgi:hypothetical protein